MLTVNHLTPLASDHSITACHVLAVRRIGGLSLAACSMPTVLN